jgi:transposase-like protein
MNLSDISKMTETEARELLERIRWPNGVVCAHCGCMENIKAVKSEQRPGLYRCGDCKKQFTVRVNSILHDTHFPIRIWMMAFQIMSSAKKGISALQLQRQLGIGYYKCAWHLCHRIRFAMKQEPLVGMLQGVVEVDETYVGGNPRKGDGKVHKRGRGTLKAAVLVLVERNGNARSMPVARVDAKTLKTAIRENVERDSIILTDEMKSYEGIGKDFDWGHITVNHSKGEYDRGGVNTNTAESFFSLLKRGVMGSFHHVSKKHLGRYTDEFACRWNHRKVTDGERTVAIVKGIEGRRLTYKAPLHQRA